ncbi:MAG: GNAT family N-acetyltransferase [Clostridiales bacterium]|nr:GNAT family N-acetyltransferase [Clostridiales bacterium]
MRLFRDTVHTVNRTDYSEQQLEAWAPESMSVEQWENSLAAHHSIVVEYNGTMIGFGDLILTGYLDRLYVHKDYQRRGVGTAITDRLEQYAADNGISVVTTDASITAKPFFEKRGYRTVREQTVIRRGQTLTNYRMKLLLKSDETLSI